MKCTKSDKLFMKYMDNTLLENEALELNIHIKDCAKCKEEFLIYDRMINELSNLLTFSEAPCDFECKVMEKIKILKPIHEIVNNTIDNIIYFVWAFISTVMGLGFLLTLYKDTILDYFEKTGTFTAGIQILKPFSEAVSTIMNNFIVTIGQSIQLTTGFLTDVRFYFLGIVLAFGMVYYFRNRFIRQKSNN